MLSNEEKLKRFSQIVYQKAQETGNGILSSAEQSSKTVLDEFEDKCLAAAYKNIQQKIKLVKREMSEAVLKVSTGAKKELLEERNKMIDQIFSLVLTKLQSFKQEAAYFELLTRQITEANQALGDGCRIFLDKSDEPKTDELKKLFSDNIFLISEENQIGGICAKDACEKKTINFSFAEKIKRERERFLSTGGFIM